MHLTNNKTQAFAAYAAYATLRAGPPQAKSAEGASACFARLCVLCEKEKIAGEYAAGGRLK